ncbi:helix-turn-helix domain-containing protein [Nostoc sp. CHAB 5836]|uniref:helix-turn-helix domain-containing protein n=1 Tax=Nostoc sp. CHAB 5836 TaxID=2780404 RepID=UPI001E38A75A|nr:helix-turn-helix transcriptional regulator [Nostoc sp. CHAB 5836]MCC5616367.1 helix-turn-helix domain-containing protein [Nostoc sp. CHAB 5836]
MTSCHIIEKLKQARVKAGLTQQDVGRLIHCTQSSLSKKEKGDRPLYAWELLQLCQLYGISPVEFTIHGFLKD